MEKILCILLILFSSLAFASSESLNIHVEEGSDTGFWDTDFDQDDQILVKSLAALAGSKYGLEMTLVGDTDSDYYHKYFTQITTDVYRIRVYLNPNSLTMANNEQFYFYYLRKETTTRVSLRVRMSSGAYQILGTVADDAVAYNHTGYITVTNAPHYIELRIHYASSDIAADGGITMLIDGVQQTTRSDIDLYDLSKPDNVLFGFFDPDVGTSGTFYMDEIIITEIDEEIGVAVVDRPQKVIVSH